MLSPEVGTPAARRRKIFWHADQIGLTRDERIELAQYLLRRDVVSWKNLEDDQVDRLLDALEGWALIRTLLELRP